MDWTYRSGTSAAEWALEVAALQDPIPQSRTQTQSLDSLVSRTRLEAVEVAVALEPVAVAVVVVCGFLSSSQLLLLQEWCERYGTCYIWRIDTYCFEPLSIS